MIDIIPMKLFDVKMCPIKSSEKYLILNPFGC